MKIKINASGQIPIPLEIQEKLKLYPGTEIQLEIIDDVIQIRKQSLPNKGTQLITNMRGKATSNLDTDTILHITRDL